ncbi:bifunctional helix-turn-helix domain-containing protein/methylated-DNA--[protein]-cysteine S-methyltransferase [Marivibrio halodurans]|uniref:Bifunctional helix-turn-helix domain-containing protein/methylated-DNA--[protein]-cysteine S-methyltransferase n=1 Tax=Marivibrio halodurans TaxID=2039722 RepID=A0A8J7V4G8_9PROT|nr:bifunctional helix-turn-helix domain-containing protein/methylated-DNA--[protein]-cysteine S-methyltransferase [Marivibrio halodurans]MBP5857674.1 bifunctional helix-turn-helix domain-containing protein/methylated-DNA--[protein]-cysteine S-methyltransferase [Marivibrio halodurans]
MAAGETPVMTDTALEERPVTQTDHAHYDLVGESLAYIAEHWGEHPSLGDLAARAGMSEHHFQRVFTRWAGLSPKKFLSLVSLDRAKEALHGSGSVLDASFDAGLSGPGRLHDLFVTVEAMTPGDYKRMAEGLTIRWGWHEGPFGETLLLRTERGLCGLAFLDARGRAACFEDMAMRWPKARLVEDRAAVADDMARIFADRSAGGNRPELRLLLKGTQFQVKVWEALMRLPPAGMTTYGDIARRLGMEPGAARAVGTAVGANPLSWLIPCHRVIRNSGMLGGYRWGLPRKVAMLGHEASGRGLALHPTGKAA